jgi:ankyrin repeat protein
VLSTFTASAMGDCDVSGGTAGESSPLIDRAQPAVLEMRELHGRTNTDSPDVGDIDENFNTPLHHAVISFCRNDNNRNCSYSKFYKLMSQEKNLNIPNKEGYTALGCAVEHGQQKCVKLMLKHPLSHRLHLDCYPGDRECTLREIIKELWPEVQPLLPAPLIKKLSEAESDISVQLLAALHKNKFKAFCKRINETTVDTRYDEPYYSCLIEIACQMKKSTRFINLLLDSGANPNMKNCITGMPLLHTTARSGNFDLLKILLNKENIDISIKDEKDRTILHWLAQARERKPGDKDILEECFKLLLLKHSVLKIDIDSRDVSGNTALYVAIQSGFRDRAKLLLSEGADISLLGNACLVLLPTTLRTVQEILDDCLVSNNKPVTSKDIVLTLNRQLLTHIVPRIAECQHLRELLKHSVIYAFLILKWVRVRYFFFLYLGFYLAFLFFVTLYILFSEPYSKLTNAGAASNTSGNFSCNDRYIDSCMNDGNFISQNHDRILVFLWLSLTILWFLLILNEMMQLIVHRWVYVVSRENWLVILLIIATFISCSGVVESVELKLHSSAVALFLGWFEMLLMSGRLPLLSVQFEMLKTVSLTFLSYMMGYVTLLIAFSLSFYMFFRRSSEQGGTEMFTNPFISFLKTIVMFTGEFEASDVSFDTLPYTSHVIFLLFVVLVAIVLLNLLNGLAVSDTAEIKKDAETLSLVARAKLISRIEGVVNALPNFTKCAVELKDMPITQPTVRNTIGSDAYRSLLRIISEKTKPRKKDKPTEFSKEWRVFTEKLSKLELRQEKLEKKLYSTLD